MSRLLIPRISLAQAVERFAQLQELVRSGNAGRALVLEEDVGAVPNRTGGSAPTPDDIHRWREEVTARVDDVSIDPFEGAAKHSAVLGRALEEVIAPSLSDAAHGGGWAYLSLFLFPCSLGRGGFRREGIEPGSLDRGAGGEGSQLPEDLVETVETARPDS